MDDPTHVLSTEFIYKVVTLGLEQSKTIFLCYCLPKLNVFFSFIDHDFCLFLFPSTQME